MSGKAVRLAGSPEGVFSAWQSLRKLAVAGNQRQQKAKTLNSRQTDSRSGR